MRKRRNALAALRNSAPASLVDQLQEEIKEFFQNMSLYFDDAIFIELFTTLYEIQPSLSYLDICEQLHINEKKIKKFMSRTERFIGEYINKKLYLSSVKKQMHKNN